MEDKRRIMDLVKEGKISVEEALRLIEAMEGSKKAAVKAAPPTYAPTPPASPNKGIARMIRIAVDGEDVKVKVNVPVALAKFASNFIPTDAQNQLASQGIDIGGILDMLKGELPEGRLVDVEINDVNKLSDGESKISGPMKVLIEVV